MDNIALTPPMGWSSWNCYGATITQNKIMTQVDAMVSSGLVNYGFTYINIDDGWQGQRGGPYNAIQGNEKFPDMRVLADYVHSRGLKIGIYSTPREKSYAGYPGGANHEYEDARQWADWGIDFLKYDWNMSDPNEPSEQHVITMHQALAAAGRDIVFSLSNSAPLAGAEIWSRYANMWRTTGDIVDTWESVSGIGLYQDSWRQFARPGHWNDPDMLVLGRVGWGDDRKPSRLNDDEQRTHFTLWCMLAAPLILGCDLIRLNEPLIRVLTNRDVIAINQDSLGIPGRKVMQENDLVAWVKPLNGRTRQDRSRRSRVPAQAVAIINMGNTFKETVISLNDIGVTQPARLKDLWGGNTIQDAVSIPIQLNPHGAALVRCM